MKLSITRQTPHEITVELEGAVDLDTVPDLQKELARIPRKDLSGGIRLDASKAGRFDTSGIAMLVEFSRLVTRAGGTLVLSGLGSEAQGLIRLAQLENALLDPKPSSRATE